MYLSFFSPPQNLCIPSFPFSICFDLVKPSGAWNFRRGVSLNLFPRSASRFPFLILILSFFFPRLVVFSFALLLQRTNHFDSSPCRPVRLQTPPPPSLFFYGVPFFILDPPDYPFFRCCFCYGHLCLTDCFGIPPIASSPRHVSLVLLSSRLKLKCLFFILSFTILFSFFARNPRRIPFITPPSR